ncbi:MAG: lysylphosphatidylglycerol synthase domain-containing protein [Candidatus Aminicenantes bacterium]
MSKKRILSLVLSALLSLCLGWLLLSRITVDDLVQTFSNIYYPALFTFLTISLFSSVLRALRYKWLLSPTPIGFGHILLVTFIRNLFVDLFPARIGSLSYVYVLNKGLKYPFELAASTFVVAFVFDFLTLSPFLILSMLLVGLGATSISNVTLLVVAFVFLIVIVLVLYRIIPITRIVLRVYTYLLKFFRLESKTWVQTSIHKLQLTIEALQDIKGRKIQWPLFLLSLVIRAAKYGSLYFLLLSLLRYYGYSLANLSFWKTILGITGAEMTGALPIKGIAGFGTWESGWALTFQLLDFEQRIAILSGIGVHLISNIFEYSLGILSILLLTLLFLSKKKSLNP